MIWIFGLQFGFGSQKVNVSSTLVDNKIASAWCHCPSSTTHSAFLANNSNVIANCQCNEAAEHCSDFRQSFQAVILGSNFTNTNMQHLFCSQTHTFPVPRAEGWSAAGMEQCSTGEPSQRSATGQEQEEHCPT